MEDFFNALYRAFSGDNNSLGEETTTIPSSRTSSVSEDSGIGSRSMSFSDDQEDLSRRNSSSIVAAAPPPNNSNNPSNRNNSRSNNPDPDDGWGAAEIAAGIAGVAIAGYAVKKMFFDNNETKASSSRVGYEEEEEEIAWGRVKSRNKANDIFEPSYVERVSKEIRRDAEEYPVIGLDCQWTQTFTGSRKPVALLQISSHKGKTVLIRLSKNQRLPHDIGTLLNNPQIIKSGIETYQDGEKLFGDYGINVIGTYDLRFLAEATGRTPDSLEKMAKKILGREINREMIFTDWDAKELSKEQIEYAKSTAQISVDAFKRLITEAVGWVNKNSILNFCQSNLDKKYIYRSERWN